MPSPGPEWTGLEPKRWYRQNITFDMVTRQILTITLRDIADDELIGYVEPSGWYLEGGPAATRPPPSTIQISAFSQADVFALDNLRLTPCVDYNGDGFVDGIDYDMFVWDYEFGRIGADFNGDGFVDGIDYDCFVNAFEIGCW